MAEYHDTLLQLAIAFEGKHDNSQVIRHWGWGCVWSIGEISLYELEISPYLLSQNYYVLCF